MQHKPHNINVAYILFEELWQSQLFTRTYGINSLIDPTVTNVKDLENKVFIFCNKLFKIGFPVFLLP